MVVLSKNPSLHFRLEERRRWAFLLALVIACCVFLPTAAIRSDGNVVSRFPPAKHVQPKHPPLQYNRLISYLYNQTDINKDGSLTFDDCYERILYFYVHLNRRAAVEPPTRASMADLYRAAGWNPDTKRLNQEEFSQLAHTLLSRAGARFFVYKVLAILVAPHLAAMVVDTVEKRFPSERQQDHRVLLLRNEKVWLSWMTIVCSKQLPRIGVALVNWCLDRWQPFVQWFLVRRSSPSSSKEAEL